MSRNKKMSLNTLLYIMCDVLVKGIPFLLMPVVARFLTVEEYGQVAIFQTSIEVCVILTILGSHQYYRYEYFKGKVYKGELFLLVIIISFFTFLLIQSILIIFYLLELFSLSPWYLIIPSTAFFQSIISLYICKYQNEEKPFPIARIVAINSFVTLILSIALLVFGFGVESRYIAIFFATFLVGIFGLYKIYKSFSVDLLKGACVNLKSCFYFGVKSLPTSLSWWFRTGFDRLALLNILGAFSVGTYAVTIQFSLILTVIGGAVNNSVMPTIFKNVDSNNKKANRKIFLYALSFLLISLCILDFFLPVVIEHILPQSYHDSIGFLDIALMCALFNLVFLIGSNFLVANGFAGMLSFISIVCSGIHAALVILLIDDLGVLGVFYSGIISYGVGIVALYVAYKFMIYRK
ncbi:oligosaccharide flippase family protein [Pseudoalteromonas sp. SWN29]|uniref:lipopolysaccharide biosynthesis protein n=1 Tax=Pseudoalteromonas sp. SWN29 TaxID=2792064 RepID=UPI0018CF67BA|nr:oligosaccharide flippase family protein [Pseudoalteromonas sp. SWN29]MBH0027521.1 oligosaccharide flippase family protein [Pseudoalteromonas sp. SWN29]